VVTLLAALLCAQIAAAEPAPLPRPAEAVEALRYGDWLEAQGDHYRAIGEYQRVRYLDPTGPLAGVAGLRMAGAYAEGGRAEAAVTLLRQIATEAPEPATRAAALYEQGRVRYLAGQPGAAVAPLAAYAKLEAPAGGPGRTPARLLLSLARLHDGDEPGARRELEVVTEGEEPRVIELRLAIDEVARAPRRSPVVAGLLSAAVPGLGHAYAGDAGAAAGAFALNGIFIWATVEAYRDRRPGLGTLLLVGESLWYGGAIFGAVAEAMRFNRDARTAALDGVDRRLRWVVEPVAGGATVGARLPFQ
jgi:tetratricopeptide (TPR) repeat protein